MTVVQRLFTVVRMPAKRDDRDSSATRRQLTHVYDHLRRAELARAREMRARIERALQAARQRTTRDRG